MPTQNEMRELIKNCNWQWTTFNNVSGYHITGPSGKSIFLPAAGYHASEDVILYDAGLSGDYWSSTLYELAQIGAYCLDFNSSFAYWDNQFLRLAGCPIRAVLE